MKKRKILYVLLFLIMSFFFFKGEVYAADAYAKCWYSITSDGDKLSQQNPIKLYLEAKNGVVTKKFENYKINTNGYQNYASWTASFVRDVPFDAMKSANDSNKLSCPVVYYKIDISGQATFKYNMSVYRCIYRYISISGGTTDHPYTQKQTWRIRQNEGTK